jgi:hypothetical protein
MRKILENEDDNAAVQEAMFVSGVTETDLACSAWNDPVFAVWFMPFAQADVLYHGIRASEFFVECGQFAKTHKKAMGQVGDKASVLLTSTNALKWFESLEFPSLPGNAKYKATSWQVEKAKKYLASRHNRLLAERLNDAERVRDEGDGARADMIATEARRRFGEFRDTRTPCRRVLDDLDAIVALGDDNPPSFTVDGELGRLLNHRLKGDNLGVILANQKIGKTTALVSLATIASRQVPTLFVTAGDETELKINGRVMTNVGFGVVEPEHAGRFAMPVPDCAHNAMGTCPIGMSGEPRLEKDWKVLLECGALPEQLADGSFEGSRTVTGKLYQPCCRCFPTDEHTPEAKQKRRNWRSAVWWRTESFDLMDKNAMRMAKQNFVTGSRGGLWVAEYPAGKLTVDDLEERLESLDRTENVVPQVVILDYFDLLKQPSGRATDKDHDGMRMNWEALRSISFRKNILIITATQTNRAGGSVETHTIDTIGRCAKSADNCTWMLTLNQTIMERRAKVMRASVLFARAGKFDPEHQALCYQWHEIQDSFAFSTPIFCKTKQENFKRQ